MSQLYVIKENDLSKLKNAKNHHNGLITNKFNNSLQYSTSQDNDQPERKLVLPQEYRVLNIVTEYMDGGDLYTIIQNQRRIGILFKEDQILDWFVQLCLSIEILSPEIRDNKSYPFLFPKSVKSSLEIRKLVSSLLKIYPNDRPSVEDILLFEKSQNASRVTLSCQDTSSQKNMGVILLVECLMVKFTKQKPAEMNLNALSSEGKSQETQVSSNVKKSENHKNIQKPQSVVHKSHVKEEPIRKSLAKSVKAITNHNDGHTETGETKNNNLKNSPQHNSVVESTINSNNFNNISSSNDKIDIRNSNFGSEKTTNETRKPSQTSTLKRSTIVTSNAVMLVNALQTTKNSSTTIEQAVSVSTNNASNAPNTLPLPIPPLSPSKKVNYSNNEDNTKITITSSSLLYSIASKDTKKKSRDTPFSLIEGLKQDIEHLFIRI
ncbi:2113_t:CDS:2 [Dentiscutata erythropus]|uniref:non-specific serine/threonine protein kinase n=1 Tax=Dentiscutata erythropus TaxID=1348616 RepID=A0A9N9NKS5_9GLOM|nr:2113_t:CDS:2 [Dentiscutata erythropus]